MKDCEMNEVVSERFNRINRHFGADKIRLLMVKDNCLMFEILEYGIFMLGRSSAFHPNGAIYEIDQEAWENGILVLDTSLPLNQKTHWLELIGDGKKQ